MALRDNALTKTNEELFKASVIEMAKVLKMERRQHSLYQQPMRMFVSVEIQKYINSIGQLQPFDAKCSFIQMLDPVRTHMYVENYNLITNQGQPIFSIGLFIKSITSQYNYDSVGDRFWGLLPGTPWSGEYDNYTNIIQSNTIGLPLSDVNFTNNNTLTFDARKNLYIDGLDSLPILFNANERQQGLTFTLVFYRHQLTDE
jgi:hypothetical protein